MISARAGKSNLQMKTSPRQQMAKIELKRIAVDVLQVKSTMSAKGVATIKMQKKVVKNGSKLSDKQKLTYVSETAQTTKGKSG